VSTVTTRSIDSIRLAVEAKPLMCGAKSVTFSDASISRLASSFGCN